MADGTLAPLLLTAAVLLAAARAVGWAFARVGQPRVIGEIIGGLLLGPTVLGAIAPGVQRLIVPDLVGGDRDGLALLASLGLLVLMFSAGSRTARAALRADGRAMLTVALVGMAVPFAVGLLAVQVVDLRNVIGPADSTAALGLVLATVIAITSVPVIARILGDLGLGETRFARLVLVVGVLEDLTLYAVLGVAVGLVAEPGGFGLLPGLGIAQGSALGVVIYAVVTATLLGSAVAVMRADVWARAFGDRSPRDEFAPLLCAIATGIAGATYLGVSSAFAALMVGIATASRPRPGARPREAVRVIEAAGQGALVPIYFASVGATIDLGSDLDVTFVLQLLVLGCGLKATSVYLGARVAGEPSAVARALAVALNARGGQGIIAASLALNAGIINGAGFTSIVLLALVTSAFAGWWLRRHRGAILDSERSGSSARSIAVASGDRA